MHDGYAIEKVKGTEGKAGLTAAEIAAWQHILNMRLYRSLSGWYGRETFRLVKAGIIKIPAGWNDVFPNKQGYS
jgi:hypothetical protein